MERLDIHMVQTFKLKSRSLASELIRSGGVSVNGQIVLKCGTLVGDNDKVALIKEVCRYVSRAGLKLEKAKTFFDLDFNDKVVLDIGASTGGFTDFCLQNGAKKVYSVDVGHSQLDETLRKDKRVVVMEKTDIRLLNKEDVNDIDIAVCDVSFISLKNIGENIKQLLNKGNEFVCLIKHQFECGRKLAKKYKGVVKDESLHKEIVKDIENYFESLDFKLIGTTISPIYGGDGNIEYLSYYIKK